MSVDDKQRVWTLLRNQVIHRHWCCHYNSSDSYQTRRCQNNGRIRTKTSNNSGTTPVNELKLCLAHFALISAPIVAVVVVLCCVWDCWSVTLSIRWMTESRITRSVRNHCIAQWQCVGCVVIDWLNSICSLYNDYCYFNLYSLRDNFYYNVLIVQQQ